MIMPPRLGEVIKQARQARRLTLRRLADQVLKEDATPISPQYLFDIEVHHHVPAPHVLRELARVLALEYGTLLALAGGADVVVREYLQRYPAAGSDRRHETAAPRRPVRQAMGGDHSAAHRAGDTGGFSGELADSGGRTSAPILAMKGGLCITAHSLGVLPVARLEPWGIRWRSSWLC
jgi:transcriptional regulator with XRE-family HTH domain